MYAYLGADASVFQNKNINSKYANFGLLLTKQKYID